MIRTFHPNMSPSEYHAMPGYGSSALRCFAKNGPLDFWWRHVAKKAEDKDSAPKRLGRCFHKAMEVPGEWKDWIVRVPTRIEANEFYDMTLATIQERGSKSKAKIPEPGDALNLRQDFDGIYVNHFRSLAAMHGKDFLNDDEIGLVNRQINACWDNQAIRDILESNPKHEAAATLKLSHITLKALEDLSWPDMFGDFKTTKACNPHQWWYEFKKNGYAYQFAGYRIVTGKEIHKAIYVRNTDPVEAQIMDVPFDLIREEYDATQRHIEWLDQHMGQAADGDVDSNGIPLAFHNEPWGAEIDPQEMFVNTYQFAGAEEVEVFNGEE